MSIWKEGDLVRIVTRPVTDEDKKKNRYFAHMGGLEATVQNAYADGQAAVSVSPASLGKISSNVHETATKRMWEKFSGLINEDQRKALTKDQLEFQTHYVLLVQDEDLERA